jgi:DNA polymerase-3 subunit epsilon
MTTMSGLDFVAVDFETANGKRESACGVGVALVRNGEVVSSDSWLIKPPASASWFNKTNTAIHGITKEDCMAEGIPWPETARRLGTVCSDLPVIAHNASFDRSVWEAANRASDVTASLPTFHCTLQLSRGHLDLVDYKLPTVVRELGLDDFPHHRAEADAVAAAQVTIELARRTGASTVEQLWERAPRRSTTGSSAARPASPRRVPESVFRTHVDRPTAGPSLADPLIPTPTSLEGEVIVITGELTFGDRETVEERLREAGAIVAKSTTKKVTCLVIAAGADVRNPPLTGASTKEKKAVERLQEGQRIAVIGEPELRELLDRAESGVSTTGDIAPSRALDEVILADDAATDQASEKAISESMTAPAESRLISFETPETAAPPKEPVMVPASTDQERSPARSAISHPVKPMQYQESTYTAGLAHSMHSPKYPVSSSATVPSLAAQQMPSQPARPERRWMFHVVMWSTILFLTVGMLIAGILLSLVGVPESTWAAVVGISWLVAPVVFLVWLVMTIARAVRVRR